MKFKTFMKKILSLVVALIAISQVNANGTEPHSPVGMSVLKNGHLVKVFYQGEETGKVKVTIYNEKGSVVFREIMKDTENFMRPYNFSGLPVGIYTIEVVDGQTKRVKKVSHATAGKKAMAVLTRLRGDENKYMLAIPNEGRNALTVRIFDSYNKLLYSKRQAVEGDFASIYNLNKLEGAHVFEVADEEGNVVARLKK